MGFFKGRFGRSHRPKGTDSGRCMECGMTGDSHTDWCPAVAEHAAEGISPVAASDPTETVERDDGPDASRV